MSKSKVRGGAKAHRKKVELRNQKLKTDYEKAAKIAWDKFNKWKQEQDGNKNNEGFSITPREQ